MAKVNPIQLQKHLKGMEYPASKQDIVDYAKQQGADDNAIAILEQLPEEEYETPTDVNKAVGEVQ
ncbi:MAG: hypothetical protein CLLPBCKN_001116 [Chroococcidiopsis cubana SAG 39.79]|uniref:DUF2795 domain-containing protein n=2 Tax=Chroococcidiopsis TaxID=54298 RepID=K9U0C9_CHRTP|nr:MULTISPECIES: DUF2795 domain-containing protein [Chroococcidiopsis]PSB43251.1 DUF2795 domain-containing protein [Cyanosarcina cf. burmensis CCALA 770]AFY88547.1 hypothetical protein Chro_3080 [Chroococcidiopsis thermalis PCC 7203]MDZ4871728.1 hypothetical protein [Chroococcidiopsis cubana SAG 39.79]PSB61722.1 DUF2795 domain-containing protein [Chroococcidiopsis cubana CCALA 043]RUT12860.1 hypothetical protein DSM107010_17050 [Chroococcidiopsis cubana SAG 39.79]